MSLCWKVFLKHTLTFSPFFFFQKLCIYHRKILKVVGIMSRKRNSDVSQADEESQRGKKTKGNN